jgi:hypothetical protein
MLYVPLYSQSCSGHAARAEPALLQAATLLPAAYRHEESSRAAFLVMHLYAQLLDQALG